MASTDGKRLAGLCGVVLLLAAPGCVRYEPRPLLPGKSAERLQARSLDDEGLRRYLDAALRAQLPGWPLESWPLETLTHTAFYFHPDLDVARARWSVARTEAITAGARAPSGASLTPAYTVGDDDRAPWFTQFGFDLTLDTADKRGHRTTAAVQRAEAERYGVALTAWAIYAGLRDALTSFQVAASQLQLLREEHGIRSEYVSLLDTQVNLGELARPVLDAARLDLQRTELAVARADATRQEMRRAVAQRIGIPASAIADAQIDAVLPEPVRIDAAFASGIVATALQDRIELRQLLADYAATEASLRLAVAQQVPDLGLGPVVRWAVDSQRWSLGTGFSPLSRQRGPIAEATARRDETAARFYGRQAAVVAEAESAVGSYHAALAAYDLATQLLMSVGARDADLQTLFDLRDIDAVALVGSRLEVVLARRAQLDALAQARRALGALEDAVHRPLTLPGGLPTDLETAPVREP